MTLSSFVTVIAIVMLFLFGLESLSLELQKLISDSLKRAFDRVTQNRFRSLLTGLVATSIIQSSSAVTTLAVTLAGSGAITMQSALGILIGSNIGTCSTAFLVSFKLEFLGAYLIVLGSIVSFLPIKARVIGKSLFYFGFILFVLDEMGATMKAQFDSEMISHHISNSTFRPLVLLYGIILSALFQSSSLITGLGVAMVDQGLLGITEAIYIVLGANIGTTSTALIASLGLNQIAKKVAFANLLFNLVGVVAIYPFANYLVYLATELGNGNSGAAVAYGNLIFNVTLAILLLPFVNYFSDWVEKIK
jgi:Na/Pi-cotransporter